ncbi:MAG: WhiB family transcriptional regulator [Jatrophihabitans sp.]
MSEVSRLPQPLAENWDWQVEAACRGLDSKMFFHPENERGPSRRQREQRAKQVCDDCPVVRECLAWALRTREPYGVWGGLSTHERDAMIRSVPTRAAAEATGR